MNAPYIYRSFTEPLGEIWCGDCREIALENPTWLDAFDFIFADPPFNIGHGYDVYLDDLAEHEFAEFMAQWIGQYSQCLRNGGVFAIHVPDALVYLVLSLGRALGMQRIGWPIWHYRFGQCHESGFISSRCHCLIFRVGDAPHTWNADAVKVESDRASKYADDRTLYTATPGLRVPLDVWDEFPRVQGNNLERRGLDNHPNQLPELYVARLLKAYTNPGNLVCDPFGGTGTTFAVARALNRQAVTMDISESYCSDIANRKAVRV